MALTEKQINYEFLVNLRNVEQRQREAYDKALLLLSAGALVLSITFIDNIIGSKSIVCKPILIWSWVSLVLCIISVLVAFDISIKMLQEAQGNFKANKTRAELGGRRDKAITFLNRFNGALFVSGIISMVVFALLNLGR